MPIVNTDTWAAMFRIYHPIFIQTSSKTFLTLLHYPFVDLCWYLPYLVPGGNFILLPQNAEGSFPVRDHPLHLCIIFYGRIFLLFTYCEIMDILIITIYCVYTRADIYHLTEKWVHILLRWRQGLSVIMEKKPGVLKVNKIRAVVVVDADFNFVKNSP